MDINNNIPLRSTQNITENNISESTAQAKKESAKVFDFTQPSEANTLLQFNNSAQQLSSQTLLESLQNLLRSLSASLSSNSDSTKEDVSYADSIQHIASSNMTARPTAKPEPSLDRLRVHNEDGASIVVGRKETEGFEIDKEGRHKFNLETGSSIARRNPDHPAGPLTSRVEAYTEDEWAPEDGKVHTFQARINLGNIQDDTSIFQIKQNSQTRPDSVTEPAITTRVQKDDEGNYSIEITGANPERENNPDVRPSRLVLATYQLPLEADGTPAPFKLIATDDGAEYTFKLNDENGDPIATDETGNSEISGKHLNVPSDDSVAFRWGLYSNEAAKEDSQATFTNLNISSRDV